MPNLVLIDLGSCLRQSELNDLVVWQGGPIEFASPEVLGHKPCKKSDVWYGMRYGSEGRMVRNALQEHRRVPFCDRFGNIAVRGRE